MPVRVMWTMALIMRLSVWMLMIMMLFVAMVVRAITGVILVFTLVVVPLKVILLLRYLSLILHSINIILQFGSGCSGGGTIAAAVAFTLRLDIRILITNRCAIRHGGLWLFWPHLTILRIAFRLLWNWLRRNWWWNL